MSAVTPLIDLYPVGIASKSIASVARTVNLSFSRDPLIQWLRPNAQQPWEALSDVTCKAQAKRIMKCLSEALVFQSAPLSRFGRTLNSKISSNSVSNVRSSEKARDRLEDVGSEDAGVAVILHPPKGRLKWTIRRVLLAWEVWLLDIVNVAVDPEVCEKVSWLDYNQVDFLRMSRARKTNPSAKRVKKMLQAHDAGVQSLQSIYGCEKLWYLEVVAVHPSLQSYGLGSKTMQWIIEFTERQPIMLECTRESNIPFYERFGFRVVEAVELWDEPKSQETGKVKLWVMVRE